MRSILFFVHRYFCCCSPSIQHRQQTSVASIIVSSSSSTFLTLRRGITTKAFSATNNFQQQQSSAVFGTGYQKQRPSFHPRKRYYYAKTAPLSMTMQQQPSSSSSSLSWCCTASIDTKNNSIQIQKRSGYLKDEIESSSMNGSSVLDITTSVDWMEYMEILEKRENDLGGAGAYDTLRCDYKISNYNNNNNNNRILSKTNDYNSNNKNWHIWGLDYHLQRLRNSYQSLLLQHHENLTKNHNNDDNNNNNEIELLSINNNNNKSIIDQAVLDSKRIFDTLLQEAENTLLNQQQDQQQLYIQNNNNNNKDVLIQLIRFTWLWSPEKEQNDNNNNNNNITNYDKIIVRGHATCNVIKPIRVHQSVQSIICTIAASDYHTTDQTLPTRTQNPQNKVASWTKSRKRMELPNTYKPSGVSEVLMVRKYNNNNNNNNDIDLELLEGLSSNLFILYNDNTLRTPTDGVLYGYVRHLVLECAKDINNNISISNKPILLSESNQWKEAFITSSSRLIYPISKILIHDDIHNQSSSSSNNNNSSFKELWHDPKLIETDNDNNNNETPVWQELLNEILSRAGYPPQNNNNNNNN